MVGLWGETKSRYPLGGKISATVRSVTIHGIQVSLPNGGDGVIPRYEIDWKEELIDPRERYSPQDQVVARVSGIREDEQRLVLSVKRLERDPWDDIEHRHAVGSVVGGRVVRKYRGDYFVEVEPGLDAFLPGADIAGFPDVLYIGDNVEALVTQLSTESRQMRISVAARVRLAETKARQAFVSHRMGGMNVLEGPLGEIRLQLEQAQGRKRSGAARGAAQRKPSARGLRVLLLDNDPAVLASLKESMERAGDVVTATTLPFEARQLARDNNYDVAALDYDTPFLTGAEVAREILEAKPQTPVVLITALRINDVLAAVGDLPLCGVLAKPVTRERILETLENRHLWIAREDAAPVEKTPATDEAENIASRWVLPDVEETVDRLLASLHEETGAKCVAVFHVDPQTLETSLVGRSRGISLQPGRAFDQLRYSPVHSVVLDGQEMIETNIRPDTGYCKHLLDLLRFRSLIGLPIRAFTRQEWGLFVFGEGSGEVPEGWGERARFTAALLQVALENGVAWRAVRDLQRLAALGQMTASFGHEVYNRLTVLASDSENLRAVINDLRSGRLTDGKAREGLVRLLGRIESTETGLRAVANVMRDYSAGGQVEEPRRTDVKRLIGEVMLLFGHEADRCSIALESDLPEDRLIAGVPPSALIQALIGLILNAIQQITIRGFHLGHVVIRASRDETDKERPVRIHVIDNGPGVHGAFWGRIFEPFFTTRKGGSGLGLAIAKGLLEPHGGRIWVESSVMFMGSTFAIALPAWQERKVRA